MATITITIPDQFVGDVLDVIVSETGWTSESPLTKQENAEAWMQGLLREKVKGHKMNQEFDGAQATVDAEMATW